MFPIWHCKQIVLLSFVILPCLWRPVWLLIALASEQLLLWSDALGFRLSTWDQIMLRGLTAVGLKLPVVLKIGVVCQVMLNQVFLSFHLCICPSIFVGLFYRVLSSLFSIMCFLHLSLKVPKKSSFLLHSRWSYLLPSSKSSIIKFRRWKAWPSFATDLLNDVGGSQPLQYNFLLCKVVPIVWQHGIQNTPKQVSNSELQEESIVEIQLLIKAEFGDIPHLLLSANVQSVLVPDALMY